MVPYEHKVSAASITPSTYLIPITEVPVTMGLVVLPVPEAISDDRELVPADPPDEKERDMIKIYKSILHSMMFPSYFFANSK
mmetsp:Transcript_20689/g.29064  ORF Transcript_20689/g.29064 Transcript_20689/m.29064 type:complete len:82 (-) Transcript_20689:88-333(-)